MRDERAVSKIAERSPGFTGTVAAIFHVGMVVICASAVYTLQPPTYTKQLFGVIAAAAVIVAATAYMSQTRPEWRSGVRLGTALLAGIVFHLAYSPQLNQLPGLENLPPWVSEMQIGLGAVGLAVALIAAGVYLWSGCDRRSVKVPFQGSMLAAAGLVIVLNAVMYASLVQIYDLQGGFYARLLTMHVVAYSLLFLLVMRLTGARAVGNYTTWYLAAAIILASARHILGIGMM
ncbi:MAG: hypothetical protein R6V19_14460 [Armatimonadota bacterium]